MSILYRKIEDLRQLFRLLSGRLRALLLRFRGAHVASKVFIGRGVECSLPWGISLGRRVTCESNSHMKLVNTSSRLEIGDFVFVGYGTEFDVQEKITIGAHTQIAPYCFVTDHNHGISKDLRVDEQSCVADAVHIGEDVWLGTGVVILPGVTIGNGAVIGANSVVSKNIPPFAIAVGCPAKVIKYRE